MIEINNKYQIGQKVFFLDHGKAKCDVVKSISVFVYESKVNIVYDFQKTELASKYEDEVFPTEVELKAFVFDELGMRNVE